MRKLIVSVTSLMLAMPLAASAQPGGTLAKIKETGEIRLGHREVSVPFSYYDDQQKPVGFLMDLCSRIVDAAKAELAMANIKVTLQPVQLGNQLPLIQNGTIDIVCGPATNTLERQKVVAFSNTIFVSSIRAIVRSDGPVKRFQDLKDKPVALTAASTSVGLLTKFEQNHGFQTIKIMSPDHATSFQALLTGRAVAFVMDDIFLASLIANSRKPSEWRIMDEALRVEPYGLIMRKDDAPFKALVDRTLGELVKSGEFGRLYNKWFQSAIPPKGVNLNFPMTQPLKDALASPNDRGV